MKKSSKTKVLLVFPNKPIISEPCCEGYNKSKLIPYELATTAGALRDGFDVRILDAKAESLSFDEVKRRIASFNPDVVAMWTVTITYLSDIKILEFAKSLNAKTALVLNPPILLKQVLERFPFLDFALHPERHFVLRKLLECLEENGNPAKVKGLVLRQGSIVKDTLPVVLDLNYSHPPASLDLLPMEQYTVDNVLIRSSACCPYQCSFCFWGRKKWRTNSVKQTVDEIETLVKRYGAKNIGFSEQHFTLDRQRVFDFCEEVKRRNLKFKFFCNSRVNNVDSEMLLAMKDAGLSRIFYGVEHINDEILKAVNKSQSREQVENAINLTKKAGIPFVTPFLVGLPGETDETIQQLKDFILKVKPWTYHVLFPVPYPGTELFEQVKKNNWLLVEEKPENFWVSPDFYRPLFAAPPMTVEKLIKARRMLQFVPRLHPLIFLNTVRDAYSRGGLTKLSQVFEGGFRMLVGKGVQKA